MNWKKNNKSRNCQEQSEQGGSCSGGIPIFLTTNGNDEQSQNSQFCPIRVVENKIFFYSDIDDISILELNRILVELDIKLQNLKNVLGSDYTPTIHLHINSPGGSVFSALAAVDTIRALKSKVYTYVDGMAASAATLICGIGTRRFVGAYGHVLIHQLSSEFYGKFSEMEDEIYNCTKLMQLLKDFYKRYTKMPMKKLDEILKRDIWLSAEEAVAYGIMDEII